MQMLLSIRVQQYYKLLTLVSFVIFLFTVMNIGSILLLLMTMCFLYQYVKKSISNLNQKDLYQLVPKKWKKQIQDKSFMEYVENMEIVRNTPVLNFIVPMIVMKFKQNKQGKEIQYEKKQIKSIENFNQHQFNEQKFSKMIKQTDQLQFIQNMNDKLDENQKNHQYAHKKEHINSKQMISNTTCESSSNGKRNYPRKTSFIFKKKFAQQISSQTQQNFTNNKNQQIQKRISYRSSQQNKIQLIPKGLSINQNSKNFNPNPKQTSVQPHNPLRTFQQYVKALMWMMKRLLGLKKMTNKIKRASTIKITLIASFFWIVIYLQIKVDSRKGKLFFKSLHVLSCVLSVLAGLGTTAMLGFKVHKAMTEGDLKQQGSRKEQIKKIKQDKTNKNNQIVTV